MTWKNRIIGEGEEDADQLLANPFNARIHPHFQQQALGAVLDSIGWIQRVIVNQTTGHIIDGHLRVALAISKGAKVPVSYVELTEDEEKVMLLSYDWITQLAVYDQQKTDELLQQITHDDQHVQALLTDLREQIVLPPPPDTTYTRKIEAPTYTPAAVKPATAELYDDTRTRQLVAAVQAAPGLPEEVRQFLIIAAQRHTVLNFGKIADFYAHADADLQRLMEDSALVIIDFNRAIELGFVQLSEQIAALVKDEYGDDDE